MRTEKRSVFCLLLFAAFLLPGWFFPAAAQNDTLRADPVYSAPDTVLRKYLEKIPDTLVCPAIELPGVPIVAIRNTMNEPGTKTERPDSILVARGAAGTLTDLLGQNGMLFLKSYGGGSLATTALRGASASQTPVMWNGLNLQSPTNGNVDLSLLPAILFDDVSVKQGSGSAGWGSGAIGGVISTGTMPYFGKGWNVRYAGLAGSFGELSNAAKIGYSGYRVAGDIRAYRQQAENDFTFRNLSLPGTPEDTLTNSDFLQEGIQGQVRVQANYRNYISARCWYQSSDRGIAPTMLETYGRARQKDEFLRAMLDWHFDGNKFDIAVRSALLKEYLYFDVGYPGEPVSITNSVALVNEALAEWKSGRWRVAAGLNNTWTQAEVTQFVPLRSQDRTSLFTGIQFAVSDRLMFALNLRKEQVDGKFVPLVGTLGCDWSVVHWLGLKASVSRNYRIPTFNDLYWVPGGNPLLRPEDSWNEEVSLELKRQWNKLAVRYTGTVFNRNTTDWILWQPGPGYWSPENLLSVWSRGVEHRVKAAYATGHWKFTLLGGYDYVRATSQKTNFPADVSLGKQLVYVPADRFNAMCQVAFRKWYVAYLHQYTGIRFTASDHSAWLPGFSVAQVTVGKRMDYKSSWGDVFVRVNNVFDVEYQAIAWRPMPGRNFQVGVSIDFNRGIEN